MWKNKRGRKDGDTAKKPVRYKKRARTDKNKGDDKVKNRGKGKVKCPVWVANGTGKSHPELERVIARPFISTVFFNPQTESFGFPVPDREDGEPHILGGLHARMKSKFFKKIELPKVTKIVGKPRRLPSSKGEGSRADKSLERAIKEGAFPDNASPYGRAVWDHWTEMGHVPVMAQLPVVMTRANLCTAGDYFTVSTEDGSLHLWELKTGWPLPAAAAPGQPGTMSAPLSLVENTAVNRWQVQVELTRMAYEREMGMKIDAAHVIHAWQEREEGRHEYTTRVKVIEHADLSPPGWPSAVDMTAVYQAL